MRIGPYTKLLLQIPGCIHKIQSNLLECQNYDLVKSWNSRQAITCNLLSITSFTTWHKLMASAESAANETAQPLTSRVQCFAVWWSCQNSSETLHLPSYTCLDLLWDYVCLSCLHTHSSMSVYLLAVASPYLLCSISTPPRIKKIH